MKKRWIWEEENTKPNDWVVFEKTFEAGAPVPGAKLFVTADTKYTLWLNGKLLVLDGGLFRESSPGRGYYDEVPLDGVHAGENRLLLLVWYHGNGGRCSVTTGQAGVCFFCEAYGFASDRTTLCTRESAYVETAEPRPAGLYGGHNVGYDARKVLFDPEAQTVRGLHPAAEHGEYGCAPWGESVPRPVPLIAFDPIVRAPYEKTGDMQYTVTLPRCCHTEPYFEIEAAGGEVIDIRSDRYVTPGGPGDRNSYRGQRTEYICRPGFQCFESYNWQSAESLIFTIPDSVKIHALGYRNTAYAAKLRVPETEDPELQTLLEKCVCTLDVCMRDGFMDCPDRERGQWIGDVSVQAAQVFYAGDDNAVLLLKKAIHDFVSLRKGDCLVGNVPGSHAGELPAQSLNAISELGMTAEYLNHTHDAETAALCRQPFVRYLRLWETDENGLVIPRAGSWPWQDHLFNIDAPVLENAWYYSALRFTAKLCTEPEDAEALAFLNGRAQEIEAAFDRVFWNGRYYASGTFCDERANALAVDVGLAKKENYPQIRHVLVTTMNCTPYFEYYVLMALCEMGYKEDAWYRMMTRYYGQIHSGNSTVWEDFRVLGTRNHAWSGGPLTIVCRYFPELVRGWHDLKE